MPKLHLQQNTQFLGGCTANITRQRSVCLPLSPSHLSVRSADSTLSEVVIYIVLLRLKTCHPAAQLSINQRL